MSDARPRWVPRAPELFLVALAASGLVRGLDALVTRSEHDGVVASGRLADGTAWPVPVTVALPAAVAEAAGAAGGLVLTDAEGTPVAAVAVSEVWLGPDGLAHVAGPVHLLPGAPTSLHHCRTRTAALVVRGAPQRVLVAAARHAAASAQAELLVLVPDTGRGDDRLPARVVTAAARAAFAGHRTRVVEVPLGEGLAPERGRELLARLAAALGADELLVAPGERASGVLPERAVLPARERLVPATRVAAALDHGIDLPGVHPPEVARVLLHARPPRSRRGLTILFTGLSGSGKSTVARGVHEHLDRCTERTVSLLDGDVFRRAVSAGLGFSRADRESNVRRIGYVATEVTRHGGVAVCAPIAPYDDVRREVRRSVEEVGDFLLVHVATPLEVCEARDRKGLYAAARAGRVTEFTGISDPYEVPADADLVLDTTHDTVEESVGRVLDLLRERGSLPVSAVRREAAWTSR